MSSLYDIICYEHDMMPDCVISTYRNIIVFISYVMYCVFLDLDDSAPCHRMLSTGWTFVRVN